MGEYRGTTNLTLCLLKDVFSSTAQTPVRAYRGCVWELGWPLLRLLLHRDLARLPDSHTEVGVTAGPQPPPPPGHRRFISGFKWAGKLRTYLILARRKKNISDPSLGFASPDWLGQFQPLQRQKYTPLAAAIEPNPLLVWHCAFKRAVLIYSSLVSDFLLGRSSTWREWGL